MPNTPKIARYQVNVQLSRRIDIEVSSPPPFSMAEAMRKAEQELQLKFPEMKVEARTAQFLD